MKSLNFLSPERKRAGVLLIALRSLTVILGLALISAVLVSTGLAAAERITSAAAQAETAGASAAETRIAGTIKDLRAEIAMLQELKGREGQYAPIIADLVQRMPPTITLSSLAIDEERAAITLRGRAETRDALLAFETGLKSSPHLGGVTTPLSSLTQPTNIDFTITATLAKPKK